GRRRAVRRLPAARSHARRLQLGPVRPAAPHPAVARCGPGRRPVAPADRRTVPGTEGDGVMTDALACRLCGQRLTRTFVDLGMSPPGESSLRADQLATGE